MSTGEWSLGLLLFVNGLLVWQLQRRVDRLEESREKHRAWLEKVAQMHVDRIDDQTKITTSIKSMMAVLDAAFGRVPRTTSPSSRKDST